MGIGIGDVLSIFATLLALGIVFPGLLLAWSLILPGMVERARERVSRTPGRSFVFGAMTALFVGVPIAVLLAAPGPLQAIGYGVLFVLLAIGSIGAAGVAGLMGERLRGQGVQASSPGALVRGSVALEFAVIFPIIGWFIVLPLVALISLGAATFALLRWGPKKADSGRQMADGGLQMADGKTTERAQMASG